MPGVLNGIYPAREIKVHSSIFTLEGTCQVGQVNFNFYLRHTILTCRAKGDRMKMKVIFL